MPERLYRKYRTWSRGQYGQPLTPREFSIRLQLAAPWPRRVVLDELFYSWHYQDVALRLAA